MPAAAKIPLVDYIIKGRGGMKGIIAHEIAKHFATE
jgi:hypothetical protein